MPSLVSIIIPFYNEEQYLAKAVTSAVEQSYAPLEIILVNDGSTDNSLKIAQDFEGRYNNIKIISTENKGLSHARNDGMAVATGEYYIFLDSDDILNKDAVYTWLKKIQGLDADIVISRFSMINIKTEGERILAGWKGDGNSCSGYDAAKAMYEYRIAYTAWAKLYRASLAKQLHFPEGYWFEDRPFLLSYFLQSSKIVFEESSQVNVLSREGSITRRLISERRIKDAYAMYLLELNIVSGHPNSKELTGLMDRHFINTMLETLIILYYDKKSHPALNQIKKSYAHHTKIFVARLKKNGTKLGPYNKANLALIQLHKLVGWRLLFLILPFWKRKKCRSVLFLKSF